MPQRPCQARRWRRQHDVGLHSPLFTALDSLSPLPYMPQVIRKLLSVHNVRTPLLLPQRSRPCPQLQRISASAAGGSSSSSSLSAANGWLLESSALHSSSSNGGNGSGLGSCYDAIMMLGGGLLPDGGMPEWVVRRLEGCLHLYHAQVEQDACSSSNGSSGSGGGSSTKDGPLPAAPRRPSIVLLGAGTPHKPPVIDAGGYVLHESTGYADYLMSRGVPAADLLKEAQSYDTVGNGYFSLLQHALPAGWRWAKGARGDIASQRHGRPRRFASALEDGRTHLPAGGCPSPPAGASPSSPASSICSARAPHSTSFTAWPGASCTAMPHGSTCTTGRVGAGRSGEGVTSRHVKGCSGLWG